MRISGRLPEDLHDDGGRYVHLVASDGQRCARLLGRAPEGSEAQPEAAFEQLVEAFRWGSAPN